MRAFTQDIETKLEKAYKGGVSKKYGFEEITATKDTGRSSENNKIDRMQKEASDFLKKH